MSKSNDGGTTWAPPVRISRPTRQAFIPTIAITPQGVVGIAYYDAPKARTTDPAPIQYWLATSRDSGTTFSRRRVGAAFNLRFAPLIDSVPELAVPPLLVAFALATTASPSMLPK
jgi:hypothetical protein